MNLTRALDVSLPQVPSARLPEACFRFNPAIVHKRQVDKGEVTIRCVTPKTRNVFMFTPDKWELVQLFDGRRSYEQIAALWRRQCGVSASPQAIRTYAETLEKSNFWYKTPREESLAVMEELRHRGDRVKGKSGDLTKVYVFVFDADRAITWAQARLRFIWRPPFVIASLVALLLMVALWIARWDEVWRDSVLYWNMTDKTLRDVLEFYLMFAFVGFFHECGHAFTAKNFGAEVHRTGMMLIYTTPAFFVTTTEIYVHGKWHQRLFVILAGFWVELMLCAVATFIWWGTAPGSSVHDLAYKLILVGGIMPVMFNMNPLMRLDGYLFCCALLRMPSLKENANALLSGWVQNKIFRLPVAIPVMPRRRAFLLSIYGILSGIYCYLVLLFLARLTYKICYNITPEWAFLPAWLVAARIFKSRILTLAAFLKTLYVSKKDIMRKHRNKLAALAVAALIFVLLPLWRESIQAPVVLEPAQRAVLRAAVPGRVEEVLVSEGATVPIGGPVARLRYLEVETEAQHSSSQLRAASAAATQAQLRYADYAGAEAERRQWAERALVAGDKQARLSLNAPIAGVVVSPRLQDLRGAFLSRGTVIAEIQDLSSMRARIYVPDGEMRTMTEISGNSIKLDSRPGALEGKVLSISPTPQAVEPGLVAVTQYKGLQPPPHYVVTVLLNNDGSLRGGMTGEAKIFGSRHSLAGLVWRPAADFIGRKLW